MPQPPEPAPPLARIEAHRAADLAARLAPLAQGLELTEAEVIALGLDLVEELLSDDPDVMRARVATLKTARHGG
jgi:hypothetical protein